MKNNCFVSLFLITIFIPVTAMSGLLSEKVFSRELPACNGDAQLSLQEQREYCVPEEQVPVEHRDPFFGEQKLLAEDTFDYINLDYINNDELPVSLERDTTLERALPDSFSGSGAASIAIPPESIMDILNETGILPLLQQDIVLRTIPFNRQSLLDYPLLGNQVGISNRNRLTGFDLFYNQMSRGYFTKRSSCLSSYINLTDETLIDRVECCLEKVKELFPVPTLSIDVAHILGLFKGVAVQQRRCGGMFYHVNRHYRDGFRTIISRFKIPFYYLERNFFLTTAQRGAIAQEFGTATADQEQEIRKKFVVSDKIGFGDCRIQLEAPVINAQDIQVNGGGYITLPTAFAFEKGLLGSSFAKPSTQPTVDFFETLFELAQEFAQNPSIEPQEKAYGLVKQFLIDGFNRMAANILDVPLGNGGHVGLGVYGHMLVPMSMFIKRPEIEELFWINTVYAEYLFPATQKRFYISKNKIKEMDLESFNNPARDGAKAAADLAFIQEELINRFFMVAYPTRIQPGIIVHGTSMFRYQGMPWGWHVGIDLWGQTKDSVQKISLPACSGALSLHTIDYAKATSFGAYRGKICAGAQWGRSWDTKSIAVSFNIDSTVINSGIGKDFVLFLKVESFY